uniref:Carboxypeptidase n=1 Tax=Panagrolaimus davidi TaxID=227884 RepID=A0A914QR70_9BILA
MGPYQINEDGKSLKENSNSWNKFASVVYIESPAGVGYSYSTDGNITTSDDLAAEENYEGIKQFFEKFPSFRNRSTFIMGESYGGVYIPTLTTKIIENQKDFPINLNGMAIGNGYLSEKLRREVFPEFLYNHGFIDELSWKILKLSCCKGCIDTCDTTLNPQCFDILPKEISFNPYDIYGKCDSQTSIDLKEAILNYNFMLTPRLFKKSLNEESYTPCLNDADINSYMNLPDVRKALNIPEKLKKWGVCNDAMFYTYQRQYEDMTSFFKKVLKAKVPILLYYGDTDFVCNFIMGSKFAAQLDLPYLEQPKSWIVNGQMAGFKTVYDGLIFTTIRGAGHMAPQLKAPETAHAIKQFVSNQPI